MNDAEIFDILDALELEYARRTSTRGVPYAGFRMIGEPGIADASITAIAEQGVLRLTSHTIDTPLSALDIVRAGSRLPLGAAYRSPDDGGAALSVGVWIGDAQLPGALLSRLLRYAMHASTALRQQLAGPALPDLSDASTATAVDIAAALGAHGHRLTRDGDAWCLQLPLSPQLSCAISLRHLDAGWLSATASYVPDRQLPPGEPALIELQKLQRWATAGRFTLDDTQTLRAAVLTPMVGHDTARAIVWTTSQSVMLLQTAARFLELIP